MAPVFRLPCCLEQLKAVLTFAARQFAGRLAARGKIFDALLAVRTHLSLNDKKNKMCNYQGRDKKGQNLNDLRPSFRILWVFESAGCPGIKGAGQKSIDDENSTVNTFGTKAGSYQNHHEIN